MIHSHIAKKPTPAHERKVELPEQVSAIVMRLLKKNAEDRYQSAFALYYTLQCVVAWVVAWQNQNLHRRSLRLTMFAFLAVMCFLVFALGIPSG